MAIQSEHITAATTDSTETSDAVTSAANARLDNTETTAGVMTAKTGSAVNTETKTGSAEITNGSEEVCCTYTENVVQTFSHNLTSNFAFLTTKLPLLQKLGKGSP